MKLSTKNHIEKAHEAINYQNTIISKSSSVKNSNEKNKIFI
jgi:hypothetical protein